MQQQFGPGSVSFRAQFDVYLSSTVTLPRMTAHYEWELINEPRSHVTADVTWRGNSFSAQGTHRSQDYEATWQLEVADDWATRRLEVTSSGPGWTRHLTLNRDDSGRWFDAVDVSGEQPRALEAPGIAENVDLSNAIDCDLGLCPLTNTMPIRRLGLHKHPCEEQPLMMAWVDVPSLRVIASDQSYGSDRPGIVNYASGTRNVHVQLRVDADGVVIDYPDLARRVEL